MIIAIIWARAWVHLDGILYVNSKSDQIKHACGEWRLSFRRKDGSACTFRCPMNLGQEVAIYIYTRSKKLLNDWAVRNAVCANESGSTLRSKLMWAWNIGASRWWRHTSNFNFKQPVYPNIKWASRNGTDKHKLTPSSDIVKCVCAFACENIYIILVVMWARARKAWIHSENSPNKRLLLICEIHMLRFITLLWTPQPALYQYSTFVWYIWISFMCLFWRWWLWLWW